MGEFVFKDVSSATWQFSTQSFSPRSVVSINGAAKNDNGLLKVRTDLSPNLRSETSRSNVAVQTTHAEVCWFVKVNCIFFLTFFFASFGVVR